MFFFFSMYEIPCVGCLGVNRVDKLTIEYFFFLSTLAEGGGGVRYVGRRGGAERGGVKCND